ncbi:MAG TPA: ABC transporter permease, partial [Burkholderiaceae bacterium]|nr:ABC transporter permease [Burkholderiaceae bacterium]
GSRTGEEILQLFDALHAQGATVVRVTHEDKVAQRCRMRSLPTMPGIAIGVAAVIATVALTEAMGRSVTQQFEGLGSQALTVRARNAYEDHLRGEPRRPPFDDVAQPAAHVEFLRDLSPLFGAASTDVEAGPRKRFAHVIAATASYQDVPQRHVQQGRFLRPGDDLQGREWPSSASSCARACSCRATAWAAS